MAKRKKKSALVLTEWEYELHLWKIQNQLDANGVGEFTYRCTGSQWAIIDNKGVQHIALIDKQLSKRLSENKVKVVDFYVDTLMDSLGNRFQLNRTFSLCKN